MRLLSGPNGRVRCLPSAKKRSCKAAAAFYGWTVIECVRDGAMRSIEDIHQEIYRHVLACLEE